MIWLPLRMKFKISGRTDGLPISKAISMSFFVDKELANTGFKDLKVFKRPLCSANQMKSKTNMLF